MPAVWFWAARSDGVWASKVAGTEWGLSRLYSPRTARRAFSSHRHDIGGVGACFSASSCRRARGQSPLGFGGRLSSKFEGQPRLRYRRAPALASPRLLPGLFLFRCASRRLTPAPATASKSRRTGNPKMTVGIGCNGRIAGELAPRQVLEHLAYLADRLSRRPQPAQRFLARFCPGLVGTRTCRRCGWHGKLAQQRHQLVGYFHTHREDQLASALRGGDSGCGVAPFSS